MIVMNTHGQAFYYRCYGNANRIRRWTDRGGKRLIFSPADTEMVTGSAEALEEIISLILAGDAFDSFKNYRWSQSSCHEVPKRRLVRYLAFCCQEPKGLQLCSLYYTLCQFYSWRNLRYELIALGLPQFHRVGVKPDLLEYCVFTVDGRGSQVVTTYRPIRLLTMDQIDSNWCNVIS